MKFRVPASLAKYTQTTEVEIPIDLAETRRDEKRTILTVTRQDPTQLINAKLFEDVSAFGPLLAPFAIELLLPIPMLSAPEDATEMAHIEQVHRWAAERRYRIIGVSGVVEVGQFGSPSFIAPGICGRPTIVALEATFRLPRDKSWLSSELYVGWNAAESSVDEVDGVKFHSI